MSGTHVSWTKDDDFTCLRCKHTSLGTKRNRNGIPPCKLFHGANEAGISTGFEAILLTENLEIATECWVGVPHQSYDFFNRVGHAILITAGHWTPFNQEPAFSRDYVFCAATVDGADVDGCVRWVEERSFLTCKLLRKLVNGLNHYCGIVNG